MDKSERKYISVRNACERYDMCRSTILKVADSLGALHRFGRVVRIDTEVMERPQSTKSGRNIKKK